MRARGVLVRGRAVPIVCHDETADLGCQGESYRVVVAARADEHQSMPALAAQFTDGLCGAALAELVDELDRYTLEHLRNQADNVDGLAPFDAEQQVIAAGLAQIGLEGVQCEPDILVCVINHERW